MAPSPSQVARPATGLGTFLSHGVPTATRAPRASSQARVNGEKYAPVALLEVSMTEKASDAPMTITRPMARRTRSDRRVRMRRQQQEQRRVDDVELLLDRQGPVVLEGRGGLLGSQVVGPDGS